MSTRSRLPLPFWIVFVLLIGTWCTFGLVRWQTNRSGVTETLIERGEQFERAQQWSQALTCYELAIKEDDDHVCPYSFRARVLEQLGRNDEAAATLVIAEQLVLEDSFSEDSHGVGAEEVRLARQRLSPMVLEVK